MSREEKLRCLHVAHKSTKQVLENHPLVQELHIGTDIARNWAVITAAYSGIEQTIKYLVANEKSMSISDLIEYREGMNHPYRTHDLSQLFSKLANETQGTVREFYKRFRSLHCYIPVQCIDEFLAEVSSKDGKGYEKWRYTLIEDTILPEISPEALVSIWGVCIQIAEEREWENQYVRFPDKMLSWEFCIRLTKAVQHVARERQDAGEPFQDTTLEKRTWLWKNGHPLNAFAELLWNFSQIGEHGQVGISDWLSDALKWWMDGIHMDPAIACPTSLGWFVTRAQGLSSEGQSIRWDQNAKQFVPVRWSLYNGQ